MLQHTNIKIYGEDELPIDLEDLIPMFHEWIRSASVPEFLVDVADYRHVPDGPGVMLIALEADYSLERTDGRWGLRYNRKAAVEGSDESRLSQALASALRACRLLEASFSESGLKFSRRRFDIEFNDRLLAPNAPETFQTCQPTLAGFLERTLGHDDFTLRHRNDPRRIFGVEVELGTPFDLEAILKGL